MIESKIDQMIDMLEFQEFDAPSNALWCPAELYTELFAAYLYKNDLINARFLWKRIPQIVKTENEHFTHLHKVYICQWQNDIGGFFTAINQQWPTNIVDIMNELKEKTYQETIALIGKVYSSLYEDALCKMLNQPVDAVTEMCHKLGWEITEGAYPRLVKPVAPPVERVSTEASENLLASLADSVSFLEN